VKRGAKPDGEKQQGEKQEGEKPDDDGPQKLDADGFPLGCTGPLFPRKRYTDWNNKQLRQLGKKFAEQASILADELGSYGADAEQLLLPREKRRTDRPWSIEIPPTFADVLQALLLSSPRPGERPGPRSSWSIRGVEAMIESGATVRAAAKAEAARTGVPWKTIDRATGAWRARRSQWDAD
jgi:hypothetical protein